MSVRANKQELEEMLRGTIPPALESSVPPPSPALPHARPRVGLALSCGGAKGLAHIGVIQVLEENGIEVDAVAGSSMGAYIAAIWGFGISGRRMEELARQFEGRFGRRRLFDPVFPPRQGFIRGNRVRRRLEETIGHRHFADMPRPARIIATDLKTLDRVVFSEGEVAEAVQASIAIPGVCVPVTIDGRDYIDGGISDPLPVDVLHEMGMDVVIAVNTIPPPCYLKCREEHEQEKAAMRGDRRSLWDRISRHFNYFASGNVLDIMMRAVGGAQVRVAEAACLHADLVLRPLAIDGSWIEFNDPGKYIALGRRVAEENLEAILSKVTQPRTHHENPPPVLHMGTAS